MITLSNGHRFNYMAASGALAFDGKGWPWEQPLRAFGLLDPSLFTVVMKTVTREPRKGNLRWSNPWDCIKLIPGGTVNAVGLTNPGIEWWCRKIGPKVDSKKIPLVGSILGTPQELVEMAGMMNEFDLIGLEVNASCPNTGDDLLKNTGVVIHGCEVVREVSRFPVFHKLSVVHDISTIVREVVAGGLAEAFSINSVPWAKVFPGVTSPLAKYGGGGVSGKVAQKFTWPLVVQLKNMTDIPVIGPSVWDFEDIETLRRFGADAISFGSIFLKYPWRPTLYVRRDMKQGR